MAASYPKTLEERAKLYLHCMLEIKERFRLIEGACAADTANLFKYEICCLQFRHICELIAIGCLAAQGDFKTQRAFREEYSPQKVFNALRSLYPNFFPQPSLVTYVPARDGQPAEHHLAGNEKPDAYGEKEVISLWAKAGDALHRLSATKYLKRTFGPSPALKPVAVHLQGLARLLESHVIPIRSEAADMLMDVRLEDGQGNVIANFLQMDLEAGTLQVLSYKAQVAR